MLYVDADNEAAVRTYSRLGFTRCGRRRPVLAALAWPLGRLTSTDRPDRRPSDARYPPFTKRWHDQGMTVAIEPAGRQQPAEQDPERFLDRETCWLQFNERVLELAEDPTLPLLERARFLAIFASNLDEFFMVRVAGLKRRIATGIAVRSAAGLEPREVLRPDQLAGPGADGSGTRGSSRTTSARRWPARASRSCAGTS